VSRRIGHRPPLAAGLADLRAAAAALAADLAAETAAAWRGLAAAAADFGHYTTATLRDLTRRTP